MYVRFLTICGFIQQDVSFLSQSHSLLGDLKCTSWVTIKSYHKLRKFFLLHMHVSEKIKDDSLCFSINEKDIVCILNDQQ